MILTQCNTFQLIRSELHLAYLISSNLRIDLILEEKKRVAIHPSHARLKATNMHKLNDHKIRSTQDLAPLKLMHHALRKWIGPKEAHKERKRYTIRNKKISGK